MGVHVIKTCRADGTPVEYHYAWRGGPRLKARPGTRAYQLELVRHLARRQATRPAPAGTVASLLDDFTKSADYRALRPSTRRDYDRIIGAIRLAFGDMQLLALEARGARSVFLEWRDDMADTPRSADMHIAVLARIFAWARDKELIGRNPLERVRKLWKGTRRDSIWLPDQLATLMSGGKPHLVDVARVALWTMQRESDVLAMPAIAYDTTSGKIRIRQAKTGRWLWVPCPDEIRPLFEAAKKAKRPTVLVNSFGDRWTPDGFRTSWGREMKRLGITGPVFHDLRGTGISYAYAFDVSIDRIAEISGHSEQECQAIIRKHYLAGEDVLAAIRKGTRPA